MTEPLLVLEFPAPSLPLSENRSRSLHWAARNRLLHPWRDAARTSCVATPATRGVLRRLRAEPVPVVIDVTLPFRTGQRRDPHNYVGTNVKAVVDGLVAAGIIPDDNPEWATIREPTTTIQRDRQRQMVARVTITPRKDTTDGH